MKGNSFDFGPFIAIIVFSIIFLSIGQFVHVTFVNVCIWCMANHLVHANLASLLQVMKFSVSYIIIIMKIFLMIFDLQLMRKNSGEIFTHILENSTRTERICTPMKKSQPL